MSEDNDRVDALYNLVSADFENRLMRRVLEDLTPTERKKLVSLIMARVEKVVESRTSTIIEKKIDALVSHNVDTLVVEALRRRWAVLSQTITEKANAAIDKVMTPAFIDEFIAARITSDIVTSMLNEKIRTIREILRKA